MRWTIKPKPSNEKIKELTSFLQVDELIASLLVQRGIETYEQARQFFRPSLKDLHDPYLMKDMDLAVNRIEKAIENNAMLLRNIALGNKNCYTWNMMGIYCPDMWYHCRLHSTKEEESHKLIYSKLH